MVFDFLTSDWVFIIGTVLLGAVLVGVIVLEYRARQSIAYRKGISRGVHARLNSVVRHRIRKLRELPVEQLRRLPAKQFERRVSYNGRRFSITTYRHQSRDGTVTLEVEARARRWLVFSTTTSDGFDLPPPQQTPKSNG